LFRLATFAGLGGNGPIAAFDEAERLLGVVFRSDGSRSDGSRSSGAWRYSFVLGGEA
jgi:hypothetical protein